MIPIRHVANTQAGEGLYNLVELDLNIDGTPDADHEACGDEVPAISLDKTFVDAVQQADGSYDVTYTITVANASANGIDDLTDTPGFDDDVVINSASYTSDAPGNEGTTLAGSGPWTLADDQGIAANTTHTYTLIVNVSILLDDEAGDAGVDPEELTGDNIYTPCTTRTAGEGLYNLIELDMSNDGSVRRFSGSLWRSACD